MLEKKKFFNLEINKKNLVKKTDIFLIESKKNSYCCDVYWKMDFFFDSIISTLMKFSKFFSIKSVIFSRRISGLSDWSLAPFIIAHINRIRVNFINIDRC